MQIFARIGLFILVVGTALTPPQSIQEYLDHLVGQRLILRHYAGSSNPKVKERDLSTARGGCDQAVEVTTVSFEKAAVRLQLDSDFFDRTFDGVVAWGLFFLLDAGVQRRLIAKAAAVLPSGGRLLFTAPSQSCSWADAMTGRTSISLGHEAYRNALEAEGMSLVGTHRDEGENHYYFAHKT